MLRITQQLIVWTEAAENTTERPPTELPFITALVTGSSGSAEARNHG